MARNKNTAEAQEESPRMDPNILEQIEIGMESGEIDATAKKFGYIPGPRGVIDWLFVHPFRHFAAPGFMNKVEGATGLAGRGALGTGAYFGIRKLVSLVIR